MLLKAELLFERSTHVGAPPTTPGAAARGLQHSKI